MHSFAPILAAALYLPGDQGQLPTPNVDSSPCCLAQGTGELVHEVPYTVLTEVGLQTCAFNNAKLLQILGLSCHFNVVILCGNRTHLYSYSHTSPYSLHCFQ